MFLRFLFISICIFIYLGIFAVVEKHHKRQTKTKVILVTVESLRKDMVTEENTPALLQAASSATSFEKHRATSGWTGTNIVSLLSGISPFDSGVHARGQSIAPELKLPLEQLVDKGYSVGGLQPFMTVELYKNLGLSLLESEPDPLLWLARKKKTDTPFFLWYHYVHTHLPYTQNEDFFKSNNEWGEEERFQKVIKQAAVHADETTYSTGDIEKVHLLHQNNILEFDNWFKKLWDFYVKGGFKRDTILIITADHGDGHGERSMVGHASTTLSGHLHEEVVQIPLFIWLPDTLQHHQTTAIYHQISSHEDIMPSILDLLAIQSEENLSGNNLFKTHSYQDIAWTGMTSSGGFSEPDPENIRYFEYGFLQNNWKTRLRIHRNGEEEVFLYDLNKDPQESEDLSRHFPEILNQHLAALQPLIDKRVTRPVRNPDAVTDINATAPKWVTPHKSGSYCYDDLEDEFQLRWSGNKDSTYIIQYTAGFGPKKIEGTLEVEGSLKNFGKIERRYWETWIVPQSPFRLRVKELGGPWSEWITLEATP